MQSDDSKQNTGVRRHTSNLSGLLEALKSLYRRISARLWRKRLSAATGPISAGEESAAIQRSLTSHLEESAEQYEQASSAEEPIGHGLAGDATAISTKAIKPSKPGFFKSLARHFGRRHAVADLQPHLAEQMQAKTTEHINKALQLARRGKAQGAKVHVELAEEAMKTASQYMDKQAYATYKEEVERRLKDILSD